MISRGSRPICRRWLAGTAVVLAFSLGGDATAGSRLTIGSVEEDVKAERAIFRPFLDYLEVQLAPHGVDEVTLLVETSIQGIGDAFDRGELDLYVDSAVLTAMVARVANAKPFLRSWKEGVSEYSTLIYARANSDVRTLADLQGRVVAFKKRESTPGFFMPRGHFAAAGLPMRQLEEPSMPVPADSIGYVFSHGDQTTLGWVMTGRVAAGVMKNDMLDAEELRGVREQLRVVAETDPMPRQVLMRRGDLDPEMTQALYTVLTEMHMTADGAAALEVLDETAKFDDFPGGGDATFARIWQMLDAVEPTPDPSS